MNIITGTKDDLKLLIDGAYQRLRCSKDGMEKFVLIDYLTQLHEFNSDLILKNDSFDEQRALLSNSQQRRYLKYVDSLFKRLEDEFIKFKELHKEHFGSMLNINDCVLEEVADDVYASEYSVMPKEEFCEYFFEFLSEYGFEEYFDKLITSRKIFNRNMTENHKVPGHIIHDPIKKRSSVIFSDFQYTVPYLLTLGHELGHVVDLSKLNRKDLDGYMKYSYSSVYGETVSTLFEKLFYDFLFRKKYRIDEVKEIYSEFLFENKNYILDAYILSLLSEQSIRKVAYNGLSSNDILTEVSSSFIRLEELEYHLDGRNIGTWTTQLYAYGEYFSTILKDDVQKQGFDSEMLRRFMRIRTGEFDVELLEDVGFEMEDYQKVYKRDVSRLKK